MPELVTAGMAAERLLARRQAREHFLPFIQFTKPNYQANWHHVLAARALERFEQAVRDRKSPRMILRMPPRGGKSEQVSRRFPGWVLGRNPDWQLIGTSYNDKIAADMGSDARTIIESPEYQELFDTRIRSDSSAKDNWRTEQGGIYVAAGVGGGITGRGAHCFPAGTQVLTEQGCIPIENLNNGATSCKVMTYEESTGKTQFKTVQAFTRRQAVGLYRITSAAGRVVTATGDHPIWTDRGYVRADSLAPGDRLLCTVQSQSGADGVRCEQAPAKKARGFLLLQCVLGCGAKLEKVWREKVHSLWESYAHGPVVWNRKKNILFQGVSGKYQAGIQSETPGGVADYDVSGVRIDQAGPPREQASILRDGLQEQSARPKNDGPRESRIHSRPVPVADSTACGPGIQNGETSNHRTGWARLRDMFQRREPACSPLGTRPKRQPLAKPDNALPVMPLHASRTPEGQEPLETDYVSSVDRIADTEGGTTVYDLQVEGNHNFFADGFLVHNCLTIDDPYKDAADAWSANTRKRIWDWLTTTALTRLMPGGGVLILLTSWHDDGLDNKLIRTAKETGEVWEVIDIPAIMEAGYSGRHPEDLRGAGESFWTSAWPVEELEKTRRRIGPNAWSALYQQRAIPDGGTIIERPWIKLWERQPEGLQELILSWDLAFKGNQDSSRVAGHLWGRRGGDFFMLARDTKVREFRETLSDFLAMANKYPRATVKLVEDKANGPALQSMLQHSVPGLKMVPVEKDKEGRLRAVSPVFASGNVYLPNPSIHPWAAEVIEELVRFPNSEYNDDTDALSQALAYWIVPGYGPTRWRNWTL